jgi:hypothetical protein
MKHFSWEAHPHGQILPLDQARRDMRLVGVADDHGTLRTDNDYQQRFRDVNDRITAWRFNLRVVLSRSFLARAKVKASVNMIVTRADRTVEVIPPPPRFREWRQKAWTRLRRLRSN